MMDMVGIFFLKLFEMIVFVCGYCDSKLNGAREVVVTISPCEHGGS